MSIEDQAAQVRKVKRSESGMIQDPVTLNENATIADALNLMAEHKIGGIPVVDRSHKLLGIVTNRDLRFEKDHKKSVLKIMTPKSKVISAPLASVSKKRRTSFNPIRSRNSLSLTRIQNLWG
jgi:IMP dehydrogenase